MSQKGLIVVALKKAFRPPPEMVENVRAILGQYDIVAASQFLNKSGSHYEERMGYTECRWATEEADIVIPLSPQAVFDRGGYTLQSAHVSWLKKQNVACWDVVGCDTDAGVLATCFALWDNQIVFRVLKDLCHSSGGPELHQAALKIISRNFAQKF